MKKKEATKTFIVFAETETVMVEASNTRHAAEIGFEMEFGDAEAVYVLSVKPAQMFGRTTAVKRIKNGA